MYRCRECGAEFSESEIVIEEWYESRGEFWGSPCSERMTEERCPFCDSNDITDEPLGYWVSAYDQEGHEFGATIEEADDTDTMFKLFNERYPNCEIADYGRYDEF